MKFDDRLALFIAPGIPAHLTLDLNLQASNTADLTVSPPVVTVRPFLVADVDPQNPKTMRLRGLLKSVNQQNQSYEVSPVRSTGMWATSARSRFISMPIPCLKSTK